MHRTTCFAALLFARLASLAAVVCIAWGALAPAAPVPPAKKPVKKAAVQVIGTWSLSWRGGAGVCTLHASGGWECLWLGQQWQGHYTVADGVLTVEETCNPQTPGGITWTVRLNATGLSGPIDGGGDFALTAIPGPKL